MIQAYVMRNFNDVIHVLSNFPEDLFKQQIELKLTYNYKYTKMLALSKCYDYVGD